MPFSWDVNSFDVVAAYDQDSSNHRHSWTHDIMNLQFELDQQIGMAVSVQEHRACSVITAQNKREIKWIT